MGASGAAASVPRQQEPAGGARRHQSGGRDVVRALVAGYGALLNRVSERVSELPLWALPRGLLEGGLQAAVSVAIPPGVLRPPRGVIASLGYGPAFVFAGDWYPWFHSLSIYGSIKCGNCMHRCCRCCCSLSWLRVQRQVCALQFQPVCKLCARECQGEVVRMHGGKQPQPFPANSRSKVQTIPLADPVTTSHEQ